MVRLSFVSLIRVTGFHTPKRVSRRRFVAKGADYLFEDEDKKPFEGSTVTENFDGTLELRSYNVIRLALDGCANRPFFRIVLANKYADRSEEIEQLGTFDPMPNMSNEKLCTFNFERIKHHLAMGAHPVKPVRRLLGLSGFLPLDPTLFIFAKGLKRRKQIEDLVKEKEDSKVADEDA